MKVFDIFPHESPKFSITKDGSCVKGDRIILDVSALLGTLLLLKTVDKVRAKLFFFSICYSLGVGGLFWCLFKSTNEMS